MAVARDPGPHATSTRTWSAGRVFNSIENAATWVSAVVTGAMMVLITVDAFCRFGLDRPIQGVYEITEDYLMVIAVFLAISYTYASGGHVRVTVFLRLIPKKAHVYLEVPLLVIALVFSLLLTVGGWNHAMEALRTGERSTTMMGYPMAPAYLFVPIGMAMLSLRIAQNLASVLRSGRAVSQGGEEASEWR